MVMPIPEEEAVVYLLTQVVILIHGAVEAPVDQV